MAQNGEIVNENGNGEWPQIVEVEADSLWNCAQKPLEDAPQEKYENGEWRNPQKINCGK